MCREVPGGDIIVYGKLSSNPFLWRLNSEGETIWLEQYLDFNISTDLDLFVEPTSDGGFICTGKFWFIGGDYDQKMYLLKVDGDGQVQWLQRYPPEGIDIQQSIGYCVRECADGGYVAVGFYQDIDNVYEDERAYLIKVDAQGDIIWEQRYYGPQTARSVIELPALSLTPMARFLATIGSVERTLKGYFCGRLSFRMVEGGQSVNRAMVVLALPVIVRTERSAPMTSTC